MRAELKGYEEALGIFDQKPVRKAALSSLKKVSKFAVSTASTEIRSLYNIKKKDLDPRMTVRMATNEDLATQITISGKGISLSYFGARQTQVNKVITRKGKQLNVRTMKRSATFQGVTVEVFTGQRIQLKSSFLAMMRSGHVGVMRRVPGKKMRTKNKQAIAERAVISLASMIQNGKVSPKVLAEVDGRWRTVFPQELKFFLERKG